MIKKEILSLCLCTGFIMSSNTCYIGIKSNETFGRSNLVSIDSNKEFSIYVTKVESLERLEKEINDDAKKRKAEEEIENKKRDDEAKRKANVCFDSYDIGVPSGITYEEMANVLYHLNYADFLPFSNAFVDAEKKYKVNAFVLVAISGSESGWNKSERANNGTNNITGMNVQSDFSRGSTYSSKYDCIMDLARQLRLYYLTPGTCYYRGISTSKVNINYSDDVKWYKTIDKIGDELVFEYDKLYR